MSPFCDLYLCGWFISWSLEHTKHVGFSIWLCHLPCCLSENRLCSNQLNVKKNFSFVSSQLAARCGWASWSLGSDPGQVCRPPPPPPPVQSHTFLLTYSTHILYCTFLQSFSGFSEMGDWQKIYQQKNHEVMTYLTPWCVCICVHICVCWHIYVCAHSFACAQNAPLPSHSATFASPHLLHGEGAD